MLEGAEYSRILVNLLAPIGDTLFATPAIHALRLRYPKAHIAALVYPSNQGILEGNPDLDELLIHPILQEGFWRLPLLFWTLRQRHFDLAVDLNTFSLFLSRVICGVPRRVKLSLPRYWWLFPSRGRVWARTHTLYHYLDALKPLGITASEPKLQLHLTESDREFAEGYLRGHGVQDGNMLIAIHPGGEGYYGKKRWSKEGFARVGDGLASSYGAKILLLGGGDERALAEKVTNLMRYKPINGAGMTTLKQTAALTEHCCLLIGNDSAPLHIAAALGRPVVGIYGPSSMDNFHPFGASHVLVRSQLPCSPCFHFIGSVPLWKRIPCRSGRCLSEITPEEVLRAAQSLLEQGPEP